MLVYVTKPGRKPRAESRFAPQAERLAATVREARVAAELSQQDAAERADVSLSWLAKLEQGAMVEPGLFPVLAVLRALDVEPVLDDLLGPS